MGEYNGDISKQEDTMMIIRNNRFYYYHHCGLSAFAEIGA